MKGQALISVITVCYNAIETIETTLVSVANQSFDNFEYIIIDGGSRDGTLAMIDKYKQYISFTVSEKDNGIYDAMNKGISKATGKWIYFLGADDVLYDNTVLENVARELKDDNVVYYGDVLFKHRNVIYDGKFNTIKLATRNIPHQAIFYPSKVFISFRFSTIYRIFADYHLNILLFNNTDYKFKYMPRIIAIFDDAGSSGSNVADKNFERNRLRIIRKFFPLPVYVYRVLRTALARFL